MINDEPTVLIVDPDPASARVLAGSLTRGGLSCLVAPGAAQALAALAAGRMEVVFADFGLPPADLTAVVSGANRCGAPLVALAGIWNDETYRSALSHGCRAALSRPVDPVKALDTARTAIATRRLATSRREDLQRLKFQYEELRSHCTQQAQRFQESQETFFLDLSRMMTIISNIMDGIVFADRDGNVTLLNPVAEDLLDVKAFLAIGKPLRDLAGRQELLAAMAQDHARMAHHKECAQTVEVHHSEQDLLYIKVLTSRVLDYRGQQAGILSVLKDVTAEYKSDQLKNQYLSIVAHELRTPLTGIKTFSTMMAKGALGGLTERQQRVIESIREQSLRLEHQIDKLINLGHLESNDYAQDRDACALQDFCSGLVAPFEQPAKDRGIRLGFDCKVADVVLWADRADLRRACQALIENAVKFTPDGGAVQVLVERRGGEVRFVVRDTGIGIDPRYHRRIFEKFFQVEDPLTRHHGGAGLGLFVAKGIVESHGSRIEVQSQLGRGAEFSFALPLSQHGSAADPVLADATAPIHHS
jgi:PAS domain S-box-containing protein